MGKNVYLLLSILLVFGGFTSRAETAPAFVGGHSQNFSVCENAGTTPINVLLEINDPDIGQTEYWFTVVSPAHGTLLANTSTSSTGGIVVPSGLSYTPATGYIGTDSFVVRITDGTLSDTTVVHVTVNPLPGPITGIASICRGSMSTLSDAGGGTWTSSSAIATVDPSTGIVSAVATGNATITYTLSTGCKATRVVTVNPVPNTISGSTFSVCTGFSIGLTDVGGGSWSSANTTIATINSTSGLLTGTGADTVTITYALATGCYTTAQVTVNQTPAAIIGTPAICLGTTTTLIETTPGGVWSSSNTAVATIAGGNVTTVSPGTVAFIYTLGTCSVNYPMTINEVAPITGTASMCAGNSTHLNNIYGSGTWTSSPSGIASVNSVGVVDGILPGNAVVTYTLSTGCSSSLTVTVNAVPSAITGTAHVCIGAVTTLGETDGGGGWSSTNTAVATVDGSGNVTGVAIGTPEIIYSFSSGCKVFIFVTVNPLPGAIGGTMSACSGYTTNLTDVGGGSWSSINTTVATINPATGMVSAVGAGTSTISYTLSSGCATSATVTVDQDPAPITGISGICLGAITTLGETVPGGVWSSSNTAIASVSGGTITTVSGGIVSIIYTLGACTVSKVLTINPISAITGGTTLCQNVTTVLADATAGGAWSSASPSIATVNPYGLVSAVAPGSVLISYTLPSGCFTSTSVFVNPLPGAITGIGHVCVGSTMTLSDAGGGIWSSGNTLIATITSSSGIVTGVATGAPFITYTLSTGCKTATQVTINPLPGPITGITSVCAGLETGLFEMVGGVWTSGNTTIATIASDGYVSGLVAGVAPITYTFPSGCLTSTTVTVNPSPTPITGVPGICQGDSTALTDGLAGGVWSTSSTLISINATTGEVVGRNGALAPAGIAYNVGGCGVTSTIYVYPIVPIHGDTAICNGSFTTLTDGISGVWSSSNTLVASVSPSGIVAGFSAGTTEITYTFPSGCLTTQTFLVYPFPGPIQGAGPVCRHATITLSDTVAGGTWTTSAPLVATIDAGSGLVTALSTGIPTITYSMGHGCFTTTVITINPLPSPIYGPNNTCPGLIMELSDPGGGTWSSGNTAIATVNSSDGYVKGVSAGTANITYSLYGCTSSTEITINPSPSPITGDSAFCASAKDTLSDVGGGLWTSGNETVAVVDSASGTVTGHVAGNVYIIYTLPVTGCKAMKLLTVVPCYLAVTEVQMSGDITIAPNPSAGEFTIKGSVGEGSDKELSITLTNMLGQVVYRNNMIAANGNVDERVVIGSNTANGMYILNLQSGDQYKTFQVVIQK